MRIANKFQGKHRLVQVAAAKRSAELPGVPAPTPRAWSFTEIYDAVKHTAERNFLLIRGTDHSPTVNETAEMHGTTGIGKRYAVISILLVVDRIQSRYPRKWLTATPHLEEKTGTTA